jgi:hypothetical protein
VNKDAGLGQHERAKPSAKWAALMAEEKQNNRSRVRTSGQWNAACFTTVPVAH